MSMVVMKLVVVMKVVVVTKVMVLIKVVVAEMKVVAVIKVMGVYSLHACGNCILRVRVVLVLCCILWFLFCVVILC